MPQWAYIFVHTFAIQVVLSSSSPAASVHCAVSILAFLHLYNYFSSERDQG